MSPPSLQQFGRFIAAGAACYLLNVLILVACVELLGLHYTIANLISMLVLIPVGHALNRRLTFHSRNAYLSELRRSAMTLTAQVVLGMALSNVLIEAVSLNYVVANAAATAALTVGSFLAQRAFVFRQPQTASESQGSARHGA